MQTTLPFLILILLMPISEQLLLVPFLFHLLCVLGRMILVEAAADVMLSPVVVLLLLMSLNHPWS